MRLIETPLTEPLGRIMALPPGKELRLFWLGQAGFVIEGGGKRVVIDPYLSDSLAEKYRGKKFPHIRMMPAPVAPDGIGHVDLVLSTHAHTDHLDPGTLPVLLAANPEALLVAPRSARETALNRTMIGPDRLMLIEAGETVEHAGIVVAATRAAHEALERDADGNHRFLGLGLKIAGKTIFHSGDTIPFEGQVAELRVLGADLALFPVNGRDAERAANGVPGNMSMSEALEFSRAADIGTMIAHHFDMFSFNTVSRSEVEVLASLSTIPHALAARTDVAYSLAPKPAEPAA
ncbi:MAG: MBL fold metallo-hydrolase [Cereibacter sphaeroides]|uniref:MBL fold metallo-hydrolase n=1 Tax=Cereibacter sphaeroides TaxID=1063 RepID=A0A2W5S1Z8_CERSP|nr:MAG: MBL fold metallo-hydrolase [Cereibacter sphaeroides]